MEIELLNLGSPTVISAEFEAIGCDPEGSAIMKQKLHTLTIKIYACKFYEANLLKQEALSVGADVAIHRKSITAEIKTTDCLLMGDTRRLLRLSEKLKRQSFSTIRELGIKLNRYIRGIQEEKLIFSFGTRNLNLAEKPLIMGILNVTPDSFSDGGLYTSQDKALKRCEEMIEEGAHIVDVGGESTRPSAEPVSEEEELKRVIPVIEAIKKRFDIPVSVDTYKARVADEAIKSGAEIVNDISGLGFDRNMINILKKSTCGIIAMHIKGTPRTMQNNPHYEHLLSEINKKFEEILKVTADAGVEETRVVLDPGIGFGKTYKDNYRILNNLIAFRVWGRPLLVGTSRKSFIGDTLSEAKPTDRLYGSISSAVVAYLNGARIFRVHDIKPTRQALQIALSITKEEPSHL